MLKLSTSRFGDIEIPDERLLTFPSGLIGFHQHARFALLEDEKKLGYQWLQSLDDGNFAFVVVEPGLFKTDYQVEIQDDTLEELEFTDGDEIIILAIVRIPPGRSHEATMNLRGPIVMNVTKRRGKQIILNESYPLRFEFLPAASQESVQLQENKHEVVQT
jgi:flagellar assembly factor FliW